MADFCRLILWDLLFEGVALGGLQDRRYVDFLGANPAAQDAAFGFQCGRPFGKQS